jgi:hypothetical protein
MCERTIRQRARAACAHDSELSSCVRVGACRLLHLCVCDVRLRWWEHKWSRGHYDRVCPVLSVTEETGVAMRGGVCAWSLVVVTACSGGGEAVVTRVSIFWPSSNLTKCLSFTRLETRKKESTTGASVRVENSHT